MGDIFKYNLKPLIKFLKILSPTQGGGHKQIRKADLAALAAAKNAANATGEPPFLKGKLNRDKLLLGTTIFYDAEFIRPQDIKNIADAGFDFLITEASGGFRDMLARECEANGLALISKDESLPSGASIGPALASGKDLFGDYRLIPAHAGDTAGDEPHASLFESMGRYYELYNEKFPQKFLFCNLFPAGTLPKRLGAKNYKDYIEKFVEQVPCDFISLDQYPFFSVRFMQRAAFAIALHTYDTVADACRKSGRDFWLYLQTQGHWFDGIYDLPSYAQISWQAYTALAYGAKCLMHISYTPVWGSNAYAMVDDRGRLTEQYLYAKRLNKEMAALSPIYMKYENLGLLPAKANRDESVMKTAHKRQIKSSKMQGFKGIEPVEGVNSVSGALVGYFKEKAGEGFALMAVNSAGLEKIHTSNKIIVRLKFDCEVLIYQADQEVKKIEKTRQVKLDLGGGQGAFLTIRKL
ncbi:MAG: hypothetical protein GX345_02885 [Clostridiales bacterium]|nr:hypothetical protein [Clostridiales bacterium]